MARSRITVKGGDGLMPIAQDKASCAELEKWCNKQVARCTTAALLNSTGTRFRAFTKQSLAKKMTCIFDGMFGKGKNGHFAQDEEDEDIPAAQELMASARGGNGLLEGE